MQALVLIVGELTQAQSDLVQQHLKEKELATASLIRDPQLQILREVARESYELAMSGLVAEDPSQKVFEKKTGYDVSRVVAIVTTEAYEDALCELIADHPALFDRDKHPVFVIRPQQSFWMDEK